MRYPHYGCLFIRVHYRVTPLNVRAILGIHMPPVTRCCHDDPSLLSSTSTRCMRCVQ